MLGVVVFSSCTPVVLRGTITAPSCFPLLKSNSVMAVASFNTIEHLFILHGLWRSGYTTITCNCNGQPSRPNTASFAPCNSASPVRRTALHRPLLPSRGTLVRRDRSAVVLCGRASRTAPAQCTKGQGRARSLAWEHEPTL